MVFHNNFVLCIKLNGKIVRENKGIVQLPFGSEYSIFLKNLNSVPAACNIHIDGNKATSNSLIVPAKSNISVERFMDSNMNSGPRFKFIERTDKIEAHRGIGSEDGIITVDYQFEVLQQSTYFPVNKWVIIEEHHHHHHYPYPYQPLPYTITWGDTTSNITCSGSVSTGEVNNICNYQCAYTASNQCVDADNVCNDNGITAKGSISNQQFIPGHIGMLGDTHSISLQLKGMSPNKQIRYTSEKLKCELCGTGNKSSNKFCIECGNNLTC